MKAGDLCTVNSVGDLYMETDARPFIGARCRFVKMTKAGLAQVVLAENKRRTKSFAPRNVELLKGSATCR